MFKKSTNMIGLENLDEDNFKSKNDNSFKWFTPYSRIVIYDSITIFINIVL